MRPTHPAPRPSPRAQCARGSIVGGAGPASDVRTMAKRKKLPVAPVAVPSPVAAPVAVPSPVVARVAVAIPAGRGASDKAVAVAAGDTVTLHGCTFRAPVTGRLFGAEVNNGWPLYPQGTTGYVTVGHGTADAGQRATALVLACTAHAGRSDAGHVPGLFKVFVHTGPMALWIDTDLDPIPALAEVAEVEVGQ